MERFQSTKTVEEYKVKTKNANTIKATTQKRIHPKNTEVSTGYLR